MTDDPNRIVAGMPELEYHRHEALSCSGAKKLLPPSCPALFKHERDNPPETKPAFDYGSAAHKELLGSGPQVEWLDAPDWKTKKAQDWAAACRLEGIVPVLKRQHEEIQTMVAALREHPFAAKLFEPGTGNAEVSAFWHDPTFGVDRRCRFDWLPFTDGGRLIIPDYKTTQSASPRKIPKIIADYKYHQQASWYVDMAFGLGLAEDIVFLLVFQEKKAPYLVTVAEIDLDGMRMGRGLNDKALETFAECTATGRWPGYTEDVELVSLPTYSHYDYEEIVHP